MPGVDTQARTRVVGRAVSGGAHREREKERETEKGWQRERERKREREREREREKGWQRERERERERERPVLRSERSAPADRSARTTWSSVSRLG